MCICVCFYHKFNVNISDGLKACAIISIVRFDWNTRTKMCPETNNSMVRYLKDIITNTDKKDLMKHEWARFQSFENFPKSADVSAVRLAQNGFFYTGHGQTVACFSCGLANDQWPENETVAYTHGRLSPQCRFLKGLDNSNVSINGNTREHNEGTPEVPVSGAAGGPDDAIQSFVGIEQQNTESLQSVDTESVRQGDSNSVQEVSKENIRGETENQRGEFRSSPPPSLLATASYPEYASNERRLASYTGWSSSNMVQPASLSEAGLFFTGNTDT